MKKRILTAALALALSLGVLTACGGDTPATTDAPKTDAPTTDAPTTDAPATDAPVGDVTLKVMIMPQGPVEETTKKEVEEKISAITKPAYGFSVEFIMSGPAWGFDDLVTAVQTGTTELDILPAHSWSGITYVQGAADGQYVRLDNKDGEYGDLLATYGPNIYGKASDAIVAAATIPGSEGRGIYGALVEKDSVQQLGFMMNNDILTKYGFTTDDFKADDFANWGDKLQTIKDGEGANFYPLDIEAEVLDRTLNYMLYVDKTTGPLGIQFDNANPAGTDIKYVSRYETDSYKNTIAIVNGYYKAGFIDPDLGSAATAPEAIAKYRANGEYAIATFVYAPGYEAILSAECGKEIKWVPVWSTPIGSTDSFMGAGLAVYAGSKNVPQAVQFLDMLNTNTEVANLISEGIEGKSYTDNGDGSIARTEDRGGWSIWRYGVVGDTSAATPLGDPNEWKNFKTFNDASAAVKCLGFLFDRAPVELDIANCETSIDSYAVALGSGAADPSQLDSLIAELKAANIDGVVAEANAQYQAWLAA